MSRYAASLRFLFLIDFISELKENKSEGDSKTSSDLLLVLGKWLTEEQHKELCKVAGDNYARLVEADEKFTRGENDLSIYTVAERLIIMDHVYLLGMLYCGGQRREFVQMMDLEVSDIFCASFSSF